MAPPPPNGIARNARNGLPHPNAEDAGDASVAQRAASRDGQPDARPCRAACPTGAHRAYRPHQLHESHRAHRARIHIKEAAMGLSRRGFLKLTSAGVAGLALGRFGIDLGPVSAYAAGMKIEGAKEYISICPFCSCGCNTLVHVKDGKIINVEGDPDYPVSGGGLCAKGAALRSLHVSENRLSRPLYRAPGSDKWEEKDWDWMLDRIARKVKDQRDKDFRLKNDAGQVVNRLESVFHLGSSQVSN
ncbi:MAG TPA: hypothetical protein DEV75_04230, partial [Desulfovibrio sp.]|nr:hypothetical protein [Desulfovibrio sp.]